MTYSLNTLKADRSPRPASGALRFVQDSGLLLAAAGLLFWTLAMLSHKLVDPAWSTSGTAGVVHNWGGRSGALLADLNYLLFGFSAWWLLLAALRAWAAAVRRSLRGEPAPKPDAEPGWPQRLLRQLGVWTGFIVLMSASCALEWLWLYRFDSALPYGSGGVLGAQVGGWSLRWFGVTGSVLLGLPLWLAASSQVFGFSWAGLAERLGQRVELGLLRLRLRLLAGQDRRQGSKAAREREEQEALQRASEPASAATRTRVEPEPEPWVDEDRGDDQEAPAPKPGKLARLAQLVPGVQARAKAAPEPEPVEPNAGEARGEPPAPSSRAKPLRQQPLFEPVQDAKLPQVELLDPAQRQLSTVDPQTLEMTSRLIEKKLGD
ncbi:MAG: hypothetical protein RLZZ555_644, partial [Pseudomonadota bacterium]